ncbi:MAG: hypothetical protein IT555_00230 [Acetobacteraceae bacterium]|nr:hypothetical protein [Acetobacteraceae bacterium]
MPPSDISDAALELLERRIADRVTEQARTRVFAYYAVIGTTVAAVLGLVGWSALGWIERQAQLEIARQIDAKSAQVTTASEHLRTLQGQIDTQLRILDALATRAARVVDRVEATVTSFEPKSRKLEQAITDIDELEERVRPVRGANFLADRNRADIERVNGELAILAQQVKALIEVGRAGAVAPATDSAYSALAGAAQRVVTATAGISRDVAASRATVYLQFAGITREAADSLRAAIAAADFQVPPAERTVNAIGLFEVRYFYGNDAGPAAKLAETATAAIRRAAPGETREAKPVPLLSFRGTKPREGTLELWYGPPR